MFGLIWRYAAGTNLVASGTDAANDSGTLARTTLANIEQVGLGRSF